MQAALKLRDTWNPRSPQSHTYHLTPEQLDIIEELAVFHCDEQEIAHALQISHNQFISLKRRQEEVLKRITIGQSKGKRAIRSMQFKVAMQGNVNMLMYLGRVLLNQCPDSQLHIHSSGSPLSEVGDLSPAAKQHLAELAGAITHAALGYPQKPTPKVIEAVIVPETTQARQDIQDQAEKRVSAPTQSVTEESFVTHIKIPDDPVKYYTEPESPSEPPKPEPKPEPQPEHELDSNLFTQMIDDAKHRSKNGGGVNGLFAERKVRDLDDDD